MESLLEENEHIESATAEHIENMKGATGAVYGGTPSAAFYTILTLLTSDRTAGSDTVRIFAQIIPSSRC